jgi:hypothetical protein
MAFFKRELSPVERFESALKNKQAERQKLADRLRTAETALGEKRAATERLAVAGASNTQLERAEASLRAVEDRAETLRAALAEFDEQIVATERALGDAKAQRDRALVADAIEAMAAAIEQAVPKFGAGATALVDAVIKSAASVPEATRFSTSVDAVRREILSAADLIYTLNPLLWREGGEVRRVPAFAVIELPKKLLPVALRHRHVDYLNARRVQTLMHVHGSRRDAPEADDPQLVDLDALAAEGTDSAQADVA